MAAQQHRIASMVTPSPPMQYGMSPFARPMHLGMHHTMNPSLSSPMFGMQRDLARQSAIMGNNSMLGGIQAGVGAGTRVLGNMAGTAMGAMAFGPLGGIAAPALMEYTGLSQGIQNSVNGAFRPLIQNRANALQMQATSGQFIRGGNALSASGQGMSMQESQRAVNQLSRLAKDRDFQQATRDMFNTQDVMQITQMAGNLGMLAQSGSADKITRDIKNVSVALSNFMKLAGEPDVQRAMQQMGNMHQMGMGFGEMSSATANARSFARMAGTSVQGVMAAGQAGAGAFAARGLSAGAGLTAGMASQGLAGLMPGALTNRQLSMLGGQQGIASTLTQGAANAASMDILLPMMLQRRNGQLSIDQSAVRDLMSGNMTVQDIARQGASNIRGLGGRSAIQELSTRRGELMDEFSRQLSPEQQAMLPMRIGMATARSGNMTLGAAFRTMGMDERQARTYELMASRPEFAESLSQQAGVAQLERREMRANARTRLATRAREPIFMRNIREQMQLSRRGAGAFNRLNDVLAYDQDTEEEIEARGGNVQRIVRPSRYGSGLQDAYRRDRIRADRSVVGTDNDAMRRVLAAEGAAMAIDNARFSSSQGHILGRAFMGPDGFGLSQAGRGGQFYAETIQAQDNILARGARLLGGQNESVSQIMSRGTDIRNMGRAASRAVNAGVEESMAQSQAAQRAIERRSGRGRAPSRGRQRQINARAGSRVLRALRNRQVMGMTLGAAQSPQAMRQDVLSQMLSSGEITQEEYKQFDSDAAFQNILTQAVQGADSTERNVLEEYIQSGSEVEASRRGALVDTIRREESRVTENFLDRVDMGREGFMDFFNGAEDNDRTRMLDVFGRDSSSNRMAAALLMQQDRGSRGFEEGSVIQQELMEGLSAEERRNLMQEANALLEGMSEEDRRRFGTRIQDAGVDQLFTAGTNAASVRDATNARIGALSFTGFDQGAATSLQTALGSGDVSSVRAQLQGMVDSGNLNAGQTRNLQNLLERGDEDLMQNITATLEQEGSSARDVFGGEGMDVDAEDAEGAEEQGFLSELAQYALYGDQRDTARTPIQAAGSFEEAVVQFSEATRDLKEAAERFSDDSAFGGLLGGLSEANPISRSILGMFNSDE